MTHVNYGYIIFCAWNPKSDATCCLQFNEIVTFTFKHKHATMEVFNTNFIYIVGNYIYQWKLRTYGYFTITLEFYLSLYLYCIFKYGIKWIDIGKVFDDS